MTFLDNFEQMCRIRGESPSHALAAVGINPSIYPKWKARKTIIPRASTVQKLADYFGCSFQTLEPNGRSPSEESDTLAALLLILKKLSERDQKKILSYILFAYKEDLPNEMQKMQTSDT